MSEMAAADRIIGVAEEHPGRLSVVHQFRYLRGLYERDGARLLVSCGIGHTHPIRINCPPEVWQVKLVRR